VGQVKDKRRSPPSNRSPSAQQRNPHHSGSADEQESPERVVRHTHTHTREPIYACMGGTCAHKVCEEIWKSNTIKFQFTWCYRIAGRMTWLCVQPSKLICSTMGAMHEQTMWSSHKNNCFPFWKNSLSLGKYSDWTSDHCTQRFLLIHQMLNTQHPTNVLLFSLLHRFSKQCIARLAYGANEWLTWSYQWA